MAGIKNEGLGPEKVIMIEDDSRAIDPEETSNRQIAKNVTKH
jgi:hypothetical protein